MHFFSRRNASLALSLAAVGVLAACGDDVTVPVAPPPAVTVSITPQAVTLNPGGTATLSVQIAGGNPTPTLQSCTTGNSAVATAQPSNGNCAVTAGTTPGSTTITATTTSGQSASAAVTVNALPSAIIGDLSMSPATAAITVGQTVTLVPSLNVGGTGVTPTYTYAVEPAGIVTLTGTGANRTVTANNPGVATVTVSVTASGTGFAPATRTSAVTINVSSAPQALTGLTVTPSSVTIPTGGVSQLAATVTGPGAAATTYAFTSSDESKVTVSGTGANRTVTAIAPGTATIRVTATSPATTTLSASELTVNVPVTVSPIANVTIQALRQGPTSTSYITALNAEGLVTAPNGQVNQPVDINNVKDQIQVVMNLQSNGQRVDSLVIYVGDGNDQNRVAAARQVFTNGDASQAGVIELPINTADFMLDWSVGVANIVYPNGLKVLSASVWTTTPAGVRQQIQNASNNRLSVNFNNIDSWAARYRYPDRVAQGGAGSNANLNWYGGPGEAGARDFTVVPVFYTPNRSIKAFNARQVVLGDNAGAITTMADANSANICSLRSFDDQSPTPYFTKYGYANVTDVTSNCQGFEHPVSVAGLFDARNYVTVFNTIDNSNNPGPFVRRLNGFRTNLQRGITQPVPNRLDYQVPTVAVGLTPQVDGAEIGWVNAVFSFATSTTESDAGVGLPTPLNQTYAWTGCTTGNGGTAVTFDGIVKPIGAAGEIPECSNDFLGGATFNGPYTVTATQPDVLGNIGTGTSNRFGVDKTAPEMQFLDSQSLLNIQPVAAQGFVVPTNADSIFDNATTTYTSAATAGSNPSLAVTSIQAHFGVRYRDERAGFRQDNHGTRNITRWAPAASPLLSNVSVTSNVIGTEFRTLNYDGLLTNQEAVVDVNDPTFRRDSVSIWGVGTTAASATAPGYYFYQISVVDRAGNSNSRNRTAAIDINSPQVTGVTIPAVLQGGSALTFGPTGTDDLEAIDGDLFLDYPTMALAGDGVADPQVQANQNGRIRFRRNQFANWHDAFAGANRNSPIVNSDGLLSTPFGPGAFLSNGGLTMPIGFYQRVEVVQAAPANENQGPHGRPAIVRLPSQPDLAAIAGHTAAYNNLNAFKPTTLGVYAFDIRATSAVAFPNRGMSSMQVPATESAYLENLFIGNITQPTQINYWGTRDVDPTTAGTQNLWSWYCFSRASTTVECRAETGTNVVNSPFSRVDFYRWKATANAGLVVADAAATAGQWIYLGSVTPNVPTNPIIQDQGVTRFWRFRFNFTGFGTANNQPDNTEAAIAAGNVIRAIGTDAQGNAIATLNFVAP